MWVEATVDLYQVLYRHPLPYAVTRRHPSSQSCELSIIKNLQSQNTYYETSNNLLFSFFASRSASHNVAQRRTASHSTTHSTASATQLWYKYWRFFVWCQKTIIDHFASTMATSMNDKDNLSTSSNTNASLGDRTVIEAPGATAVSPLR
jgi:hypothetical protein